jgi:uncharacterized protein YndB with AHSA1/START domain
VFPYLVESDKRLRWMGVLKESEPVGDGQPGEGSRYRDVFEDHGQRIEIDAEVTIYRPPELLEVRLESPRGFGGTSTSRLQERDGRTRVSVEILTEYRSRVARLLGGLVARHAQKQLEADLAALKALLEG